MVNGRVLVLNADYQPLNVCATPRAVCLIFLGKAQILETTDRILRSISREYPSPSVIRLQSYIKKPYTSVKLSRRSILTRDNNTCQYCNSQEKHMTVDHVIPKHNGGQTVWENLVCSCRACNSKKGGRTLKEANMNLIRQPFKPQFVLPNHYIQLANYNFEDAWHKYLEYSVKN
ncbi:HNH endonuclease [bacterium]|nr:HNH endonuclease [bacterium]MBU1025468.1 HNH endonuclease [bacterium]